jgi:hypothetical protein
MLARFNPINPEDRGMKRSRRHNPPFQKETHLFITKTLVYVLGTMPRRTDSSELDGYKYHKCLRRLTLHALRNMEGFGSRGG